MSCPAPSTYWVQVGSSWPMTSGTTVRVAAPWIGWAANPWNRIRPRIDLAGPGIYEVSPVIAPVAMPCFQA